MQAVDSRHAVACRQDETHRGGVCPSRVTQHLQVDQLPLPSIARSIL